MTDNNANVAFVDGVSFLAWNVYGRFVKDKFVRFSEPQERHVQLKLCPITGKPPRLRYYEGKSKFFKTKYWSGKLSTKGMTAEGSSPQRLAENWNMRAKHFEERNKTND